MTTSIAIVETLHVQPKLKLKMPHPPKEPPGQGLKFLNLRFDPARALEPARKKLTMLESQRIMSVFEETIRRVELVTLLPYILENMERFRVSLGSELVELLNQHRVIISSYDEIRQNLDVQLQRRTERESPAPSQGTDKEDMAEEQIEENKEEGSEQEGFQIMTDEEPGKRESSAFSFKSAKSTDIQSIEYQIEGTMRNLSLVAQQMSHSTKNILRAFSINPAVITVITGEAGHRNSQCQELLSYLQDLKDILMGKLLATPEEERERIAYLTEIAKRERANAVIIDKLETELKEKIEDKDREIAKKNDVIKRLQSELHQIEKLADEGIRRVRSDAEKQENSDEKNSEGKRQKLQAEAAQMKSQLQNAIQEHRESESELRTKKFKIETEVENWIIKYDQDLGERQEEYEMIDKIYTEEKKQLRELDERFHTLEIEYNSILEERRLAREKREKAEREIAMMIKAATTIQAFWRSYKVRKALQQRKKKKGGKKKA